MMAQMQQITINLMPWRSWRRMKRGRRYFLLLLSITILLLSGAAYYYQKIHGSVLALQMAQRQWHFDIQAKKLSLEVKRIVASNNGVFTLLQSIEKNIPAGVVLKNLTFQDHRIYLSGMALTDHEVNAFLSCFETAKLLSITSCDAGFEFNLEVVLV